MENNEFRNIIKLSSLYFAATVGAGFASGKEIFIFFTKFQGYSQYSIFFSGILFIFVGYIVMDYIRSHSPENLVRLYSSVFNERISAFLTSFSTLFLIGVFSIMVSGMSNIISELFSINIACSSLIVGIIAFIFLICGIDAIIFLSEITTPLLIVGIILLCTYLLRVNAIEVSASFSPNLVFSAFLYIAYNITISVVALIDAKHYANSRKVTFISAFIGGSALLITSYLINAVLNRYFHIIALEELPMMKLAQGTNHGFYLLWSLILFISMLTTAVSSAIGCISTIQPIAKLPKISLIFILVILSLLLSTVGFTQLIEFFYPLFGYFGMIFIFFISFKYIRK